MKYEASKIRAKFYAVAHEQAVTYCPAKDKVTSDALRERDQTYPRKNEAGFKDTIGKVVTCTA